MSTSSIHSTHKKPTIIISTNSTPSNQRKTNKITIANAGHTAEYETHDKINKTIIDNTVTYLQQNLNNKTTIQRNKPNTNVPDKQTDNRITTFETNPYANTQPNNNIYKNTETLTLKNKNNNEPQEEDEQQYNEYISSNKIKGRNNNNNTYIIGIIKSVNTPNETQNIQLISPFPNTNNFNYDEFNTNDNLSKEDVEMNYNYHPYCLICDKIFSKTNLYHADNCSHDICRKCIKKYYEEQIEDGIFSTFKCPVYSCKCYFSDSFIQLCISQNLFNKALTHKQTTIRSESSHDVSKNTIKQYNEDNVIDINDNKNFFLYTKDKISSCPHCKKEALFGKVSDYYVKCLNCYMKVCRLCLKEYTEDHFEITNENHCRIYFRAVNEDENESKCCDSWICRYCKEIFFVIAGFIMMFIGGYYYIKSCVNCMFCNCGTLNNNKGKCIRCIITTLLLIIQIIICCICFPFILISFPYFPVFIAMFGS